MAPRDMDKPTRSISDEDVALLSQYLDGELPPLESRHLETRLAAEDALRSNLVRLQELNHRLRDALTERAAVPAEVQALLHTEDATDSTPVAANVVRFPGHDRRRQADREARWPFALAASVVVAVAAGVVFNTSQTPGNALPGNDRLVSAALDRENSGSGWADLGDGREIQPVLTFPHQDGRWCREYLLRGGDADWRAVACRDDNRWVTQAAGLESYLDAGNAYIPAGASDAEPVAVFISQHAADIALGLDEETELLNNWQ